MHLLTLNAAGKPLAPVRVLDPRRRRLSQVVGRHVDRSRPHMIAVQRARDPLQPIEEAWVTRGRDKRGNVRPWPRTYLPADAIVVVVYLPRGGGGTSSSRGGKGFGSIVLAIAAVALVAFAGPLGGAAAAAIGLTGTAAAFAGAAITAGIAVGGAALLSLASRAKANKQATDTTQIYGVAGGGNLPKPGDRIPRGYGRSWMKPDLSQPDFSQYDGDDQILFKRHTLGLGHYRPYQVRAGKQVIWKEDGGFQAPFDDARNAIEFVSGTASELVPSTVVSASGIGGLLPRPADNPSIAGPFLINQRGALVNRLQVDFQFPQGISRTETLRSGTVRSNQPGAWSVVFQYAPIDESGAVTGLWQDLYAGNSGTEGARFATHPLRYTKFLDVPEGRYAVRGWNVQPDTTGDPNNATIDAVQWDAASGWVADAAIRDGVTEMALRIYATKATQAAAFGEVEIDAAALIPVWTGTAWEEQETSKAVWAFLDILRDQDYGGGLSDDQIDVERARGYAALLTEFDTFDGTIRGPVSVYEAAATVLLPMRAEPVHTGRYWSLVRDEPKAVRRHVITRRQILKGSSEIVFDLDTLSGASHVIGEFDQDGDYRNPNQTTALYGEASLTPTRQRWTGVRSFAHAQHLTRWRAASGAFRRQSTPFGVEMEGRIYRRGDSISVDHWFIDTALVAGVVDHSDGTLTVDVGQTVPAGYVLTLRDRTGREWGPLGFTASQDGRTLSLDGVGVASLEASTGLSLDQVLGDGRGDMPTVRMGPLAVLTENYLVQSVRMSGPDRAQVEALIDDARVWEAIGAPIVVPPDGGSGNPDPEVPHILALTANAVQMTAGLRCDFAIRPGRGAVRFEVDLSYDGGNHYESIYEGTVTTGSHMLNPVDPTLARLRARAFGATGLPGPYYVTPLSLPRSKIADPEIEDHFRELFDLADELQADALKQVADRQKQLAVAIARLRDEVQSIAEAAATVEGANYDRRQLIKAALEGRTADAFAAIETESTLRVSGDAVQASTSTLLAVRLGTAESAIQTETTARVTADDSLTSQITTAYSRLTSAELSLTGLASAQQGLTTRVTTAEGGISSLSSSYTTLSSQLTTANGQIAANGSAITNLQTLTTSINGTLTTQSQQISALQSSITDPSTGLNANATAISNVRTRTTAIEGDTANLNTVVNAQAASLQSLSTTVGGNTATLSVVGQSVNGMKLQYGILGNINGQTGGFQLYGAARLDGSVAYSVEILGSLIVTGSITARTLAAQQLILNGQIFDGAVSTIGGTDASGPYATYTFTNSRGRGTYLCILGIFNPGGVLVTGNGGGGNFEILINGGVYETKVANSVPGNSGLYVLGDAISKQIAVGLGSFDIQVRHTNQAGGGRSKVIVIELSK